MRFIAREAGLEAEGINGVRALMEQERAGAALY